MHVVEYMFLGITGFLLPIAKVVSPFALWNISKDLQPSSECCA